MKVSYFDIPHWTTIHLMDLPALGPRHKLITEVQTNVRFRGQGHAGRLLRKVIAEADREGVTLVLSVAPDGTGLDFDQLSDWYGRLGFTPYEPADDQQAMIRRPMEAT